jgi:hypothetical protein
MAAAPTGGVLRYAYAQPTEHGDANCVLFGGEQDFAKTAPQSWFHSQLLRDAGRPFKWIDGWPVFHISAPRAVVEELLGCALIPERARRYSSTVPPTLAPMALETWTEYMERYGVAVLDPAPLSEGPAPKRQRLLPRWFPTAQEARDTPPIDMLMRVHDTSTLEEEALFILCKMELRRKKRRTHLDLNVGGMANVLVPELRELGYVVQPHGSLHDFAWGTPCAGPSSDSSDSESDSSTSDPKIC